MNIDENYYRENYPIRVNNVFERSKQNIYPIPAFNRQSTVKLLCNCDPLYPKFLKNGELCMLNPLTRTCVSHQMLRMSNMMDV